MDFDSSDTDKGYASFHSQLPHARKRRATGETWQDRIDAELERRARDAEGDFDPTPADDAIAREAARG